MRKTILMLVLLVAVAGALYFYSRPSGDPSQLAGAAIVEVKLAKLNALETEGKELFDARCASCHGANAAGKNEFGPPLIHIIYETGHHGDEAFYRAALQGVRGHHWSFGDMPAVAEITRDEVSKIISYIRVTQRENGIF